MFLDFLVFSILFIPFLHGENISTPIVDNHVKLKINGTETETKDLRTKNVTLITEGGAFKAESTITTLPKGTNSDLINLDSELGKSKVKSSVPRKGVSFKPLEDNIVETNVNKEVMNTSTVEHTPLNTTVITTADRPPQTNPSTQAYTTNSTDKKTNENITDKLPSEQPKIHKKPTVLSAEAINETDKKVALEKAKLGISTTPLVRDQIPISEVKYQQISSNSHPGMVMPVVITMLVVPMFAVLGYMALRRGQEAWKNRHYKRMDFLLDGMYND